MSRIAVIPVMRSRPTPVAPEWASAATATTDKNAANMPVVPDVISLYAYSFYC